jgi:hypothetical protein
MLSAIPARAQNGSPLDFLRVPPDPGYRQIEFVEGQILDVDLRSKIITLLDGSEWLGGGIIILPVADILIIPIPGEPPSGGRVLAHIQLALLSGHDSSDGIAPRVN